MTITQMKIAEIPTYIKAFYLFLWLLPPIISYTTVKVQTQNEINNLKKAVEEYKDDHDILVLLAGDFNSYVKSMDKINADRDAKMREMDSRIYDLWLANAEKIERAKNKR